MAIFNKEQLEFYKDLDLMPSIEGAILAESMGRETLSTGGVAINL